MISFPRRWLLLKVIVPVLKKLLVEFAYPNEEVYCDCDGMIQPILLWDRPVPNVIIHPAFLWVFRRGKHQAIDLALFLALV